MMTECTAQVVSCSRSVPRFADLFILSTFGRVPTHDRLTRTLNHGSPPTPPCSPVTMQSHWVMSNMSFTAWGVVCVCVCVCVCCEVCGDAHP